MDDSIRINADINPEKIYNYEINTESFKRLRKNIETLEQIAMESFRIQTNVLSIEMLNRSVQDGFAKLASIFGQYNYEDMLKSLQYSFRDIAEKMCIGKLETFQNIDFGKLLKTSFYQEKYDEAGKMAFEYAEGEIKGEENISQEELLEVLDEQIEDKIGWQEKLYNKSEEFKRKYFVFYTVFIRILWFVIMQIVTYFAQLGIAYAFGNITEEPRKGSPVIYYFDQKTEVNIIGETENYYFITYIDSDGNEVMGYSEKEDIEIVPKEDEDTIEDIDKG